MAYVQYLIFEELELPMPNTYDVSLSAVEADTTAETEAGTKQRDVIRQGVAAISVEFSVSATWVKILTDYSMKDKIKVKFFDPGRLSKRETEMYIKGFKAELEKDTSRKGLWKVSFTLYEF